MGRCKKIKKQLWQGRFITTKKLNDLFFEIGTRSKIVHHDRIKKFHPKSLPEWIISKSGPFPKASEPRGKDRNSIVSSPGQAPAQESLKTSKKEGTLILCLKERVIND